MIKSRLGNYTAEEFSEAYKNLGIKIEKIYIYFFKEDKNKIDSGELLKILTLQNFLQEEGKLYQEIKDFNVLKLLFLEQKKYFFDDRNLKKEPAEQVTKKEIQLKPKLCIYTASPLNNYIEHDFGNIKKHFCKYFVVLYHKVLTEDELMDSYDYDAIFIFTKTNKEKIIIEDEYCIKKSITLEELEESVDVKTTFIFLDKDIGFSNFMIMTSEKQ